MDDPERQKLVAIWERYSRDRTSKSFVAGFMSALFVAGGFFLIFEAREADGFGAVVCFVSGVLSWWLATKCRDSTKRPHRPLSD